ncbi:MAG: acyl-CoA/acyl-ACP dehydrogenase [Pirellulales bacterium]|nr:acyl-CoA/acyl-ACP dehydrogenase [Pirellulales bacterium]
MYITSPDDPELVRLCRLLAVRASELDRTGVWPEEQLRLCGQNGVYEWSIDPAWGGQGWNAEEIIRGYLALSAACLTTTFVLTQLAGACRRIASSDKGHLKERLLPSLAKGEQFATVGISHLTTSRQHLTIPVLRADRVDGGFRLDGYSPWVTGGAHADTIVLGATLMDGEQSTDQQLLAAIPANLPGISMPEAYPMIGLSASHTGPVRFDRVIIMDEWLLAGPVPNVMQQGTGAGTGGYETSILAIGLANAALSYLEDEARKRPDLQAPYDTLRKEHTALRNELLAFARNESPCTPNVLRYQANSLVLRASQAALTAAKGAGFLVGHPTGRWCREALFFLVWNCPQSVLAQNLCEISGMG